MKKILIGIIALSVIGLAFYFIRDWQMNKLSRNPNFASGNGRIEATEINIAAKIAGKVEKVLVLEGEKVEADQILVVMQTNVLLANLAIAEAKKEQAITASNSAIANIAVKQANVESAKALLEQTRTKVVNSETRYKRYKVLVSKDATSQQAYENAETEYLVQKAAYLAAQSVVRETEANLKAAIADAAGKKANIQAAEAQITSIKADIDDSILKSPLRGRIQYRISEPGEVLSAGGRAINMVDLTDVYMTFFLPEESAGKLKIGSDVRIVLDICPDYPLPAKISYVASVAQFTPKTVETKVERQKLMFRVKAHIDRELLEKYIDLVKTGLPGVAWVRLDDSVPWPKELELDPETKAIAEKNRTKKDENIESVVKSDTAKKSKELIDNSDALVEEAMKATKGELIDIKVKAVKQVNDKKKAEVDAKAEAMKAAEAGKNVKVDKLVDAAKKNNQMQLMSKAIPDAPKKEAPQKPDTGKDNTAAKGNAK